MIRKSLLVFLFALAASFIFAKDIKVESITNPGNLLADVGIGWGGVSGGAEFMLAQIKIADVFPITFGAGARAFVDPGIFYSYFSSFTLGVGGFGTAHVGFKSLDLPSGLGWVSNCDAYVGLGLGFATASANSTYAGYSFKPGIGISTFEGVSYYLNDKLAITGEYGYIGSVAYSYFSYPLYYSTIGITLKL